MKNKRLITAVCVLIGVLFVAGATAAAIAATSYGSSSDPLITLSYLNDTVKPDIMSDLNGKLDTAKTELASELDKKLQSAGGSSGSSVSPDAFNTVTLTKKQVVKCTAGTEIVIRSGSATAYGGSSPRLVDETSASEITTAGAALTNDHLYIVPAANNGLRAASDSVTLLVRGGYTVFSNI